MDKSNIDEVIMVGGSTYIPKVRQIVQNFFNKPLNFTVNPEEAVCAGAAIQAAILSGHRDKSLKNFHLQDVIPMNLGTDVKNGIFDVIIKKNTSIPVDNTR